MQLPALTPEEKKLGTVLSKAISGKMGLLSLQHDLPDAPAKFVESFSKGLIQQVQSFDALEKMPLLTDLEALKAQLSLVLKLHPKAEHAQNLSSFIIDDAVGFGVLGSLLQESSLEEVMVNGLKKPIFVVHRKFGMCKTNLLFSDASHLEGIVRKIARTAGKPFDEAHPLLDARL